MYKRYATKHVVGAHLIQYLDNHEVMYEGGILASEMVEACQAVHPPYAQILEGHAGQSTSTSTSDVEFLPSLVSSAPSASTSGTSPNVQSTGQTPESLHSEGQAACANLCAQADNLAQATQQAQQSVPQPNVGADGTNFDPLQFLNPMDPTAIDQVAAMISGTHGQGLDKQANHPELSEQFMNDMLLASSLGQNGFSWN